MSKTIFVISLCMTSIVLTACGQTGALQLPSDPNYDHRAKYLLTPNKQRQSAAEPVQQQFSAPTS